MGDPLNKIWSYNDPNLTFHNVDLALSMAYIHQNCSVNIHTHNFYEINIIINGKGTHILDNKELTTCRGNIYVIPPKIYHGYKNIENLDVFHILLNPAFMVKYNDDLNHLPNYITLFEIEPYLRNQLSEPLFFSLDKTKMDNFMIVLKQLLDYQDLKFTGKDIIVNNTVMQIIGLICNFYGEQKLDNSAKKDNFYTSTIVNCMEMINTKCDQKLTVDYLAEFCNISRSTLIRKFNEICRCSPMEYLAECRIKKAKDLLLSTDLSISFIAQECGFFDSSHFIKCFKKSVNIKPFEFRNMYVQKSKQEKNK